MKHPFRKRYCNSINESLGQLDEMHVDDSGLVAKVDKQPDSITARLGVRKGLGRSVLRVQFAGDMQAIPPQVDSIQYDKVAVFPSGEPEMLAMHHELHIRGPIDNLPTRQLRTVARGLSQIASIQQQA